MKKGEDRERRQFGSSDDRYDRGGDRDDRGGGDKRGFGRKKGCRFCGDGALMIDYKDRNLLNSFLTERFRIVPRRISGVCSTHQRPLTAAIKRARHLAIVAYTTAQM